MLRFLTRKKEERTILIKIKFEIYPISTEVLNRVFSACGSLESVEKLSPGDDFHSEVCFQDQDSAIRALAWYNGRCIYDRCCKLELFQASQVRDRSNQIEVPTPKTEAISEDSTTQEISERPREIEIPPIEGDDIQIFQDSPRSSELEFMGLLGSVLDDSGAELIDESVAKLEQIEEIAKPIEDSKPQIMEDPNDIQIQREHPKVISHPLVLVVKVELEKREESDECWPAKHTADIIMNLIGIVGTPSAHQVFEEMSRQGDMVIFYPGGVISLVHIRLGGSARNWGPKSTKNRQNSLPFDREKADATIVDDVQWVLVWKLHFHMTGERLCVVQGMKQDMLDTLVFDSGGMCRLGPIGSAMFLEDSLPFDRERVAANSVKAYWLVDCILIFYPGGVVWSCPLSIANYETA